MHPHEDGTRKEKTSDNRAGEREKEAAVETNQNEWDTLSSQEDGDWTNRGKTEAVFFFFLFLISCTCYTNAAILWTVDKPEVPDQRLWGLQPELFIYFLRFDSYRLYVYWCIRSMFKMRVGFWE